MVFVDFIFIPLICVLGHVFINNVVEKHNLGNERSLLNKLFYYHLALSLIFGFYINIFGGDALGYWRSPARFITADGWISLHSPGTAFVHFLVFPFSQGLGLSFWSGTILFGLLGFFGLVCLYLTLRRTLKINPKLFGYRIFPFVLFLPNMHFWSGGIGKDSVIFFALCLFIYCLTEIRKNIPFLILSFYLAFFIRPHIALLMVVGLGMALLLSRTGVSVFWRITFLAVSLFTFVLISSTVFDFIGVEEDNIETYEDIANIRSKNLSRSKVGSRIDMASLPVPLKMATFLYRPLFFDAGNLFGLLVSLENLFYLALTLSVVRWKSLYDLYKMPVVLKACLFISMATTYFMSSSLSNLGIIIRQKNMVMFMVVLVTMYLLSKHQAGKLVIPRRHAKIRQTRKTRTDVDSP